VTPRARVTLARRQGTHLPLNVEAQRRALRRANAGVDMTFSFPQLIAHAAATRELEAVVDHRFGHDLQFGSRRARVFAERRMLETIEHGAPKTAFLRLATGCAWR